MNNEKKIIEKMEIEIAQLKQKIMTEGLKVFNEGYIKAELDCKADFSAKIEKLKKNLKKRLKVHERINYKIEEAVDEEFDNIFKNQKNSPQKNTTPMGDGQKRYSPADNHSSEQEVCECGHFNSIHHRKRDNITRKLTDKEYCEECSCKKFTPKKEENQGGGE